MQPEFTFGTWVKRRRRALDQTQATLADKVGCAIGTVRRIESDDLRPSRQIAERLALALAVPEAARPAFVAFARDLPHGDVFVLSPELDRSAEPSLRIPTLPVSSTTLIGRTHTVAALSQLLLEPDVQLVTLTGPPGVGKSRLAFQVATLLGERFADGVAVALLARLEDATLVSATLAQALAIRDDGRPRDEALAERLAGRELLLLIDNFEHVIAAAPLLTPLLQASRRLKVLVTSRVSLRLSGEHEFVVPPLALPGEEQLAPEQLAEFPALALFCARGRAVRSDFRLDAANASVVAAICRKLDGLPLAIELAAMQIKLLRPQELLTRLEQQLPLLRSGPRDAPARQQTMEAAIGWSYNLLTPTQQQLFAVLSAFAGGWTLETAERVVRELAHLPEGRDIRIDDLTSLVEHSLVQHLLLDGGIPRFTMLESIRAYGLARLAISGSQPVVRTMLSRVCLQLIQRAAIGLRGPEQSHWLTELEREIDNIRTSLAWSLEPGGDVEIGLQIAGELSWFWWVSGRLTEGRRWLGALLGRSSPETAAGAVASMGLGVLAFFAGDFAGALPSLDAAIDVGQRHGLTTVVAYAKLNRGSIQVLSGDSRGAELVRESGELARAAGQAGEWYLGTARIVQAIIAANRDDLGGAARYGAEALAIFRHLGQPYGIASALNVLGDIARLGQDWEGARTYYEASLPVMRASGVRSDLPALLHNLGYVALREGALERAQELFRESLRIHRDAGNRIGVVECLYGLAGVAAVLGVPERAAMVIGAAQAAAEQVEMPPWAAEQAERERYQRLVQEQLSEQQWEHAMASGQALSLELLIRELLAQRL